MPVQRISSGSTSRVVGSVATAAGRVDAGRVVELRTGRLLRFAAAERVVGVTPPAVGFKRVKVGAMDVIALNDGVTRRPLGEEFVRNAPLEQVKASYPDRREASARTLLAATKVAIAWPVPTEAAAAPSP